MLGQTMVGGKVVMMRKWDVKKGVELLVNEKITGAGGYVSSRPCLSFYYSHYFAGFESGAVHWHGFLLTSLSLSSRLSVPSIALDLLENDEFLKTEMHLESISYGGAPAPPQIAQSIPKLPGGNVGKYVSISYHLTSCLRPLLYAYTIGPPAVKVSVTLGQLCLEIDADLRARANERRSFDLRMQRLRSYGDNGWRCELSWRRFKCPSVIDVSDCRFYRSLSTEELTWPNLCVIRGLPLPTTDVLIIDPKTQQQVPVGEIGEVWL